jgi:small subunit ribosomal protein S20
MPITKSAKKSLKVARVKQAQNYTNTVLLEKALRKASTETINSVMSVIDKSAKTDIIHKNKAARLKSRLTKKFGTPKNTEPKVEKSAKPTEVKAKKAEVKTETKTTAKTPKAKTETKSK